MSSRGLRKGRKSWRNTLNTAYRGSGISRSNWGDSARYASRSHQKEAAGSAEYCGEKKMYQSMAAAKREAKFVATIKHQGRASRAYFCKRCKHYHLTTRERYSYEHDFAD